MCRFQAAVLSCLEAGEEGGSGFLTWGGCWGMSPLPRPWYVLAMPMLGEFESSLEEPQTPDGCHPEFAGKPEGNHKSTGGRRGGGRKILRLNLKYKGRVEAATTGISLRRPQNLALRSSRPCGDSARPHFKGSKEGLGGLRCKIHALSYCRQ